MANVWQKSLRKNSIELYGPKNVNPLSSNEKIVKRHRLSIIEEDQLDNNGKRCPSKTLKTHLVNKHPKAANGKPRRPSEPKAFKPLDLVDFVVPSGVTPIDRESDCLRHYGADILIFMRQREKIFNDTISSGFAIDVSVKNRNKVTNWMLEVLEYTRSNQVTVYHAINLLDRSLSLWDANPLELQLLAITCIWVASKLEEYYTADLKKLLECTNNSFTSSDVIKMERLIYRTLNFSCYGEEPSIFLDHLILAAGRERDGRYRELCMLLLDLMVTDFELWKQLASLKSSATVYVASLIYAEANAGNVKGQTALKNGIWTPTLKFYSGYHEADFLEIAWKMTKKLILIVRVITDLSKPKIREERSRLANLGSIVYKYLSQSRHKCILLDYLLQVDIVSRVLANIEVRLTAIQNCQRY